MDIYKNAVRVRFGGELRDINFSLSQQGIYSADGGHDYRSECEKSGEPLIQTMSPTEDAHEYALDTPLDRVINGKPRHLSAHEVSSLQRQRVVPAPC